MPLPEEKKRKLEEKMSPKDISAYEDINKVISDWDEILNDYTLDHEIASIADAFKASALDLNDFISLKNLKVVDKITGTYKPITDFILDIDNSGKEGRLRFITQIRDLIKENNYTIYDLNYIERSDHKVFNSLKVDGQTVSQEILALEPQNPAPPEVVKRPGGFKFWTNKWFGWFKKDCKPYNDYQVELVNYHQTCSDNAQAAEKNKAMMERFESDISYVTANYEKYSRVLDELPKLITFEEELQGNADTEKQAEKMLNVASGKSNERLGRHQNYQTLIETPVNEDPNLPMGGLALLSACSLTVNAKLVDGSSQRQQEFDTEGLTEEEAQLLKSSERFVAITNVGSKILDSVFGGGDIKRMGPRMPALIEGRKILNVAQKEYANGNKQPLADLLNDTIPVLYSYVKETVSSINTPGIKAFSEIVNAVDTLFSNDEELRGMVNIPDAHLKVIKGAAKMYDLLKDHHSRRLEGFQNDKGPESKERREFVENELFLSYLTSVLATSEYENRFESLDQIDQKLLEGANKTLLDKYQDDPLKQMEVRLALTKKYEDQFRKVPKIIELFAQDNVNISEVKESILANIRKTPVFEELMAMDKDKLYQQDFAEITKKLVKHEIDAKKTAQKAPEEKHLDSQLIADINKIKAQTEAQVESKAEDQIENAGKQKEHNILDFI